MSSESEKRARARRVADRKLSVPREHLWTLSLMKANGFLLMFLGVMIALLLMSMFATAYRMNPMMHHSQLGFFSFLIFIASVPFLIIPSIICGTGYLMFRCSKLGLILSCLIGLLFMLILCLQIIAYLKFAKRHPYDAVFPTGTLIPTAVIIFQFTAAYILARSWRYLKWI